MHCNPSTQKMEDRGNGLEDQVVLVYNGKIKASLGYAENLSLKGTEGEGGESVLAGQGLGDNLGTELDPGFNLGDNLRTELDSGLP